MPILHTKEAPARLTKSIFDGIENLPTHEKIKTVLYRFGQGLLGRPIEIKPSEQTDAKDKTA